MSLNLTVVGQSILLGAAVLLGAEVLRERIRVCRELNSKPHLRNQSSRRAQHTLPVAASHAEVESPNVDPDYVAFQLEIAQRKRHMQQAAAAKKQMASFLLAMVKKLHQKAATLPLTEEQRQDFDYHMQSFAAEGYTEHMPAQSLAALAAACQAIGIDLETIGG